MKISRREFLRYCVASAAVIGIEASVLGKLIKAAEINSLPVVLWLSGSACTGCTVSLANRITTSGPADIADLLINYISLSFHPNLMGAAGDLAVDNLMNAANGKYILAVEGGIPTAFNGHTCTIWTKDNKEMTALRAVRELSRRSIANVSIGTCASFGGIPSGNPNPTHIVSLENAIKKQTINIPGCPTHPDWVVWTIAQLLAGEKPALDSQGRPQALFSGKIIHDSCPRRHRDETESYGRDNYCLKNLGCKGPSTSADCPSRLWNKGTNWCIGANSICIGCTEKGYPDRFSPFYYHT